MFSCEAKLIINRLNVPIIIFFLKKKHCRISTVATNVHQHKQEDDHDEYLEDDHDECLEDDHDEYLEVKNEFNQQQKVWRAPVLAMPYTADSFRCE